MNFLHGIIKCLKIKYVELGIKTIFFHIIVIFKFFINIVLQLILKFWSVKYKLFHLTYSSMTTILFYTLFFILEISFLSFNWFILSKHILMNNSERLVNTNILIEIYYFYSCCLYIDKHNKVKYLILKRNQLKCLFK